MPYRLGVDVGGTFTDLLLINEKDGSTHTAKVPSTPEDSSKGVLNGIERVCSKAGIDPEQITHVMHGTTVATNTVLTGAGARVGLVTTAGYRQVLEWFEDTPSAPFSVHNIALAGEKVSVRPSLPQCVHPVSPRHFVDPPR